MNCQTCNKPLTKAYQKLYCSNKCKLTSKFYSTRRNGKTPNQLDKAARCKIDQWVSRDYNNNSGNLVKHLKKLGIGDAENYHIYYDIIDVAPKQKIKCPQCNWNTYDITNKGGTLTKHIINSHSNTVEDFIQKYPEIANLFFHQSRLITHNNNIKDPNNRVACEVCNKLMSKITETHVKLHGLTVASNLGLW